MTINDRGTIKWTSIMLPEHVKMLGEVWKKKLKMLCEKYNVK